MANLHLQGSLSTTGARNFKKLFVYAKVKVLGVSEETVERVRGHSLAHMLRCVWTELDYRIDICRVTKGSHTEHL